MMKKRMGLLLGTVFVFGFAVVVFVRNEEKTDKKKEVNMREKENTRVVLDAFSAIERRDDQRLSELLDPDFEIHWPPSLPYGGISRGLDRKGPTWSETWIPLQPTEAERRMDPRVVAANGNEVVVCWRQRGVTPAGDRFDGEVLGLYKVARGSWPGPRCSTSTPRLFANFFNREVQFLSLTRKRLRMKREQSQFLLVVPDH